MSILAEAQRLVDARTTKRVRKVNGADAPGGVSDSGGTAFDRAGAVKLARELLMPKRGEATLDYPAQALGPLADAGTAIADHGQLRPAMAGQCLLGAASLLTQGLFNVETLGGRKPLSLYVVTLGESGDGKPTAEEAALHPIWSWQRRANDEYVRSLADAEAAKARRKKGDPPLELPAAPHRICMDATVEGLRRDLSGGAVSQGVFTSEAAAMLAGYGMSVEHRAKTAAVFCGLWDRGLLSVSRAPRGGAPSATAAAWRCIGSCSRWQRPTRSAIRRWPLRAYGRASCSHGRNHRRRESLAACVGTCRQRSAATGSVATDCSTRRFPTTPPIAR